MNYDAFVYKKSQQWRAVETYRLFIYEREHEDEREFVAFLIALARLGLGD